MYVRCAFLVTNPRRHHADVVRELTLVHIGRRDHRERNIAVAPSLVRVLDLKTALEPSGSRPRYTALPFADGEVQPRMNAALFYARMDARFKECRSLPAGKKSENSSQVDFFLQ